VCVCRSARDAPRVNPLIEGFTPSYFKVIIYISLDNIIYVNRYMCVCV